MAMCRRIKIVRTNKIELNYKKAELIILRLTNPDGTPANSVFLLGNVERVKQKLFYIGKYSFIQTDLGEKYGAMLPRSSYRIDIANPKIKTLCKDLKIRKVVILRFNTF